MSNSTKTDYTKIVEDFEIQGDAWLHRNNHNGDTAWKVLGFDDNDKFTNPLGKGEYYISIGCNSRKLKKESYERIKKQWAEFEKICFNELYNGERPKYRYSLWRFLFEFKQGDILLVPGKHKYFHVFRIISEKPVLRDEIKDQYPEIIFDDERDFHYFWKVEPVRVNMENSKLADQSLSSRLKFRGTISWLNDALKESLKTAVTSERISLYEAAQEKLCQAFLDKINVKTNDYKFEKLIKWYFMKIGASSAKVLGKNNDGIQDADVEATFEALRVKVYVQAKKQKDAPQIETAKIQIEAYKENHHTEDDGYTYLYWIIHASAEEPKFEDETDEIRLINGIEFAGMLLDAGISGIDEAFYGKEA